MISIIIPTYNSEGTICRCLNSILLQTYSNWEVVIVDGVSSDRTTTVAKSYNDNRIRIFSENDKGIYDAMNKGVRFSSGEWLFFLGSDDWLYDNHVLQTVAQYMDENIDVVYGEVSSDAWDELMGEWTYDTLWCNRCHQSIFYRRVFFEQGNKYNIRYKVWADFDINLRWFLSRKYKSRYIPVVVSFFSTGGYSEKKTDVYFLKDFGMLVIRYGFWTVPTDLKKMYLRAYIERNAENILKYVSANVLLLLLRVVDFFKRKIL